MTSNPSAAHTSSQLYKLLIDIRNWVDYPNADASALWYRRRKAQESARTLTSSTKTSLAHAVEKPWSFSTWLWGSETQTAVQGKSPLVDIGAEIAESVYKLAGNLDDASRLAWMLATNNVGSLVTAVSFADSSLERMPKLLTDHQQAAEVLEFFLLDENAKHWAKACKLAKTGTETASTELGAYFTEAHRLTTARFVKRTLKQSSEDVNIAGESVSPGQDILLDIVSLNPPFGDLSRVGQVIVSDRMGSFPRLIYHD